jgi:hypothetical protein
MELMCAGRPRSGGGIGHLIEQSLFFTLSSSHPKPNVPYISPNPTRAHGKLISSKATCHHPNCKRLGRNDNKTR